MTRRGAPNPDFMQRALALAARGRYTSHPNPRVGCVIVQQGEVAGTGFHARAGEPHAEVFALREAGERARDADVYVTLEPCSHHGRTPPCADALKAAGVGRVIAAMEDPNPKVAGQGFAKLRAAGIECDVGLFQREAEALNRGFISRMRRGRPFVTLKLAVSLDGRTAMASGESQWITSEASRADAHRLRAEAGAVLTSVETVLADDPQMTVRLFQPEGGVRQPDRIVLDTRLRSPVDARAWLPNARRIALAVRPTGDRMDVLRARGVEVCLVGDSNDRRVELGPALAMLARLEVNEVLVESGPKLAGAFLEARLVDEVVAYVAPSLLGDEARPLANLPHLRRLDERLAFRFLDARMMGPDLRVLAVPEG